MHDHAGARRTDHRSAGRRRGEGPRGTGETHVGGRKAGRTAAGGSRRGRQLGPGPLTRRSHGIKAASVPVSGVTADAVTPIRGLPMNPATIERNWQFDPSLLKLVHQCRRLIQSEFGVKRHLAGADLAQNLANYAGRSRSKNLVYTWQALKQRVPVLI